MTKICTKTGLCTIDRSGSLGHRFGRHQWDFHPTLLYHAEDRNNTLEFMKLFIHTLTGFCQP